MKNYKIFLIILPLLVLVLFLEQNNFKKNSASFSFISYQSVDDDSFSVFLHENLKANSNIYFTNSKWNGSHFNIKGDDLVWNTGNNEIKKGAIIHFKALNSKPQVNIGNTIGRLNLDKNGDAIFSYIGDGLKMPTKFICAVSVGSKNYGTLVNTNLQKGRSIISYPKNTTNAQLKEHIEPNIKNINDTSNYDFNYNIKSLSDLAVN